MSPLHHFWRSCKGGPSYSFPSGWAGRDGSAQNVSDVWLVLREIPNQRKNSEFLISHRWSWSVKSQRSKSWEGFIGSGDKRGLFQPNLSHVGSSDLGGYSFIFGCWNPPVCPGFVPVEFPSGGLEKGVFLFLFWDFCAGHSPSSGFVSLWQPWWGRWDEKSAGIQLEFWVLCFLYPQFPSAIKTKELKNPSTLWFRNIWCCLSREGRAGIWGKVEEESFHLSPRYLGSQGGSSWCQSLQDGSQNTPQWVFVTWSDIRAGVFRIRIN